MTHKATKRPEFMKSPASKRGKGSRTKGHAGEREVAELFRAHGFPAERGYQARCGTDQPDVVVDCLPNLWVEVKRGKSHPSIPAAMRQAKADARGKDYIIFSRGDREPWVVSSPFLIIHTGKIATMPGTHFCFRHHGSSSVAKWISAGSLEGLKTIVQTAGKGDGQTFYSVRHELFFEMVAGGFVGHRWGESL